MSAESATVSVAGSSYAVQVRRPVRLPTAAPRLVVVAYQPNAQARLLLQTCVRAIQRFTPEPHELWVVDNHSPEAERGWLMEAPGVNVICNLTEPRPSAALPDEPQHRHGSFANAVALELAARLIDPDSQYFMSLHMDTAPCHPAWLPYLLARLTGPVRAAGVRLDRARVPEGVLHVLGCLVDFQLFRRLGLSFLPDLPRLDVGDRVTTELRSAGYQVFACRNSLWEPALAASLPAGSPLRSLSVDRAFDDLGRVIFLHLGRGVSQAEGRVNARPVTIEEWGVTVEKLMAAPLGESWES